MPRMVELTGCTELARTRPHVELRKKKIKNLCQTWEQERLIEQDQEMNFNIHKMHELKEFQQCSSTIAKTKQCNIKQVKWSYMNTWQIGWPARSGYSAPPALVAPTTCAASDIHISIAIITKPIRVITSLPIHTDLLTMLWSLSNPLPLKSNLVSLTTTDNPTLSILVIIQNRQQI